MISKPSRYTPAFLIAALLGISVPAEAALLNISESLKGGSLPSGLNESDTTTADRDITYNASGAVFGSASTEDNGRNYIRTNDTDYHTVSFNAFITVNVQAGTSFSSSEQVFFGLGTGAIGQFGAPDRNTNNDSVFLEFNSGSANPSTRFVVTTINQNVLVDSNAAVYNQAITTDTHRLMMQFDATAQTVRFAMDYDYAGGPFVEDQTTPAVNVSGLADALNGWAAGDAARIYFGADSISTAPQGAVISDFEVTAVPEPATLMLTGIGLLGLIMFRFRASENSNS